MSNDHYFVCLIRLEIMDKSTLVFILLIFGYEAKQPIVRPNGLWYPGKSCGIGTEIKYLHESPKDTSSLECTFIWTKNVVQGRIKTNPEDCFKSGFVTIAGQDIKRQASSKEECIVECFDNDSECMAINYYEEKKKCYIIDYADAHETWEDSNYVYAFKECIEKANKN